MPNATTCINYQVSRRPGTERFAVARNQQADERLVRYHDNDPPDCLPKVMRLYRVTAPDRIPQYVIAESEDGARSQANCGWDYAFGFFSSQPTSTMQVETIPFLLRGCGSRLF